MLYQRDHIKMSLLDPLSATEESALAHRIVQSRESGNAEDYQAARDEMIERNLKLVLRLARPYEKTGRDVREIFSSGTIGLVRAVELYNPSLGTRFSTHAAPWIKKSIVAHLAKEQTVIVPEHVRLRRNKINQIVEEHRLIHAETMSAESISEATGVRLRHVTEMIPVAVSTSDGVSGTEDLTIGDTLAHPGPSASDEYEQGESVSKIGSALATLTPQQEFVIRVSCGFYDEDIDARAELGVSADMIRKIKGCAIESLKASHGHVLRERMS